MKIHIVNLNENKTTNKTILNDFTTANVRFARKAQNKTEFARTIEETTRYFKLNKLDRCNGVQQ